MKKIIIIILFLKVNLFSNPIFNSITVNKDTIGKYERFEVTVQLNASFNNPFDKNQIHLQSTFISPTGKNYTISGFYYQDFIRTGPPETLIVNGSPHWKIRFTPDEIGVWQYQLQCTDQLGTTTSSVFNFYCLSSNNNGFIRVANNRYLRFDNGDQFFGIGLNLGWYDYPEKTYSYVKWLDSLAANNGNLIRVWMSQNAFAIEWKNTGLGNYSNRFDRAFQLDWLFDYARRKNIYIQLCLIPHGQLSNNVNPEWNDNPYNSANGGPCSTPEQFFTNETAKNFFKRRLEYIIDRWGYSPNLFAWEIFNEVDHTHNYSQNKQNVINWLLEIAQYIKSKDPYHHILTTSFANEFLEPPIWSSNLFDIIQIHHYNTTSDMQTALVELTKLNLADYNKPVAIGEYDFLELGYWAGSNDPYGINFHNSLWASIMCGAYMTAMTWSWENYIAPKGLFYHFKSIGDFINNINLLERNFVPIQPTTTTLQKADLAVAPAYPNWGSSPANNFSVSHFGQINPNSINLSKFLYGTVFNTEFRNPPTFFVSYDEPAEFKVVAGNEIGFNPRLQIWLNGIKRLDQIVNTNVTYSINVPAGEHEIFVDNQGADWMRVAEYVFTSFAVALRCYALQSNDEIIGWIHNRNYNWRYLRDIGNLPPVINDGKVYISNVQPNSIYYVEWFNPQNSSLQKIDTVIAQQSTLELNVPPLQWDIAFRAEKIGTLGIAENEENLEFQLYQNYPNPFNSITKIKFYLPEKSDVRLSIFNSLGEKVKQFLFTDMSSGVHEQKINLDDLPSGIYLYQLSAKESIQTRKLVLIK